MIKYTKDDRIAHHFFLQKFSFLLVALVGIGWIYEAKCSQLWGESTSDQTTLVVQHHSLVCEADLSLAVS